MGTRGWRRRTAIIVAALMPLVGLFSSGGAARASGSDDRQACLPADPHYGAGIADLAERLGETIGAPLDCEHTVDAVGDTEQSTTTGLAMYTVATHQVSFTNGMERWTLDDGTRLLYTASPDAVPLVVPASPAQPFTRSVVCPVLYTHEVSSQAALSRVLTALLAAGYRPTSLGDVARLMQGESTMQGKCLVLTFDDALMSQYVNALPVLTTLHAPGVFFVMPAFADGIHSYMGATEIRALSDAGNEVEGHTCNHANLVRLAVLGDDPLMAELLDCKRRIEAITGQTVDYLAYPGGATNRVVLPAVERAGYRGAFTTRPSAILSATSPLMWPRIRYDVNEAPASVLRRIVAAGG